MGNASVNKVFLMGNLSREFDLRGTSGGTTVGEMTVAVNRRNGDKEDTCFVEVVVWGKMAEACRRYLGKGSCVHVEGYLRHDTWEDRKTGQKRNKLRVVAESVQFINTTRKDTTASTGSDQANSGPIPPEYDPPLRDSGYRF